jgi:hypothetical protein
MGFARAGSPFRGRLGFRPGPGFRFCERADPTFPPGGTRGPAPPAVFRRVGGVRASPGSGTSLRAVAPASAYGLAAVEIPPGRAGNAAARHTVPAVRRSSPPTPA